MYYRKKLCTVDAGNRKSSHTVMVLTMLTTRKLATILDLSSLLNRLIYTVRKFNSTTNNILKNQIWAENTALWRKYMNSPRSLLSYVSLIRRHVAYLCWYFLVELKSEDCYFQTDLFYDSRILNNIYIIIMIVTELNSDKGNVHKICEIRREISVICSFISKKRFSYS